MKLKYILSGVALVAMTALCSCDAIEPESDFGKGGTPITPEELRAALSVTQMPNEDGKVEGDQYIVVKNNRPDIGGRWHLSLNGQETTYPSDATTIICQANGDYELYYQGISADRIVTTEPFTFTVTNVFDAWSGYLTGAADKADKGASRTWKFRECKSGSNLSICNNGACGAWNYYPPEWYNSWWGNHTGEDAANYRMTFVFDGSGIITTDAEGVKKDEGLYSFTHDAPSYWDADAGACGVLGQLTVDIPLIGAQWDDCRAQVKGESNVFWILTLTDKYMTLYHPDVYEGAVAWSNCGWYAYFEVAE